MKIILSSHLRLLGLPVYSQETDRLPSSAVPFFLPAAHTHPSVWGSPTTSFHSDLYAKLLRPITSRLISRSALADRRFRPCFLDLGKRRGPVPTFSAGLLCYSHFWLTSVASSLFTRTRWIGNLSKSHWGSWLATFATRSMELTFQPEQRLNR